MSKPSAHDAAGLVDAVRRGDRRALAKALSVVEGGDASAQEMDRVAWPLAGQAYTVGLTGAPGAGKSTLANALVGVARKAGDEIAVLAVDPSSPFSGGAILGDRVRMQDHVLDTGVFIRSMASRGHLGGLARAATEATRLLDVAGFPWILLETVGVGQAEVEVAGAADTTVVVVNPGWGDSIQANKAGLLEIADVFVINKADRPGLDAARADLRAMLDLGEEVGALGPGQWEKPIIETIASDATDPGAESLWSAIADHRRWQEERSVLARQRLRRVEAELRAIVARLLEARARDLTESPSFRQLLAEVEERRLDPYTAAESIIGRA